MSTLDPSSSTDPLSTMSLTELRGYIVQLESELESERLNSSTANDTQQQMLVRVEQQYSLLQAENSALHDKSTRLSTENKQLNDQFGEQSNEIVTLNIQATQANNKINELNNTITILESQNSNLLSTVDRLQSNVDRLHGSNMEYAEKIMKISQQLQSTDIQAAESRARIEPLQLKLVHYESELDSLRKQSSTCTNELHSVNKQLQQLTHENNTLQSTCESANRSLNDMKLGYEREISSLQHQLQQCTESADQYLHDKLQLTQSHQIELQRVQHELQTQQRLAELMKNARDNEQHRVIELQRTIDVSKDKLSSESTQYQQTIQQQNNRIDTLTQQLNDSQQQIIDLQSQIAQLNRELQSEKDSSLDTGSLLLAPQSSINDSAAASLPGYSDMYSKYMAAQQTIRKHERQLRDNARVIQQLQSELSSRTPLLTQRTEQYNALQLNYTRLSSKLSESVKQSQIMSRELESYKRQYNLLESENAQYKQSTYDLSKQVKHLLKQQNGVDTLDQQLNDNELLMNGDELVSDKLVLISNIDEMQAQNQKLLSVVRELTRSNEQLEQQIQQLHTNQQSNHNTQLTVASSSNNQLDAAYEQIESLKSTNEKLHQQFERLSNSIGVNHDLVVYNNTNNQHIDDTLIKQRDITIADLNSQIDQLRDQLNSLRDDKLSIERELHSDITSMREINSELRMKLSTAEANSSYHQERYNLMSKQSQSHISELDVLRQRVSELSAQLTQQQQYITDTKRDTHSIQQQFNQITTQYNQLNIECERLRSNEKRLLSENEMLSVNKQRSDQLLQSIQSMQQSAEQRESQQFQRLNAEKDELRSEWLQCKQQVDTLRQQLIDIELHHTKQLNELQHQYNASQQLLLDNQHELTKSIVQQENANKRVSELSAELKQARDSLDTIFLHRQQGADNGVSRLELCEIELSTANETITQLRVELQQSQQAFNDMQLIASSNESALQQLTTTSQQYKQQTSTKLNSLISERDNLLDRVTELLQSAKSNETEFEQTRLSLQLQINTLNNELQIAQQSAKQAEQALAPHTQVQERLQHDINAQAELAAKARQLYENEMLSHADTMKQLNQIRNQFNTIQSHNDSTQQTITQLNRQLSDAHTTINELRESNTQTTAQLNDKTNEYKRQVDILYGQIEILNQQATRLSHTNTASQNIDSPDQQYHDLHEIIGYLRDEKRLAETELEAAQQQLSRSIELNDRYTLQIDQLKHQLSDTVATQLNTSTTHQQQVSELNQLNILQESNAMLRDDAERNASRANSLQLQVNQLQALNEPLQQQIAQLHAQITALEQDKQLLTAENTRWSARSQKLLDKHNSVDPEQYKQLQVDNDKYQQQINELQSQYNNIKSQYDDKLKELHSMNSTVTEQQSTIHSLQQQVSKVEQMLEDQSDELETSEQRAESCLHEIQQLKQSIQQQEQLIKQQSTNEIDPLQQSNTQLNTRIQRLVQLLNDSNTIVKYQSQQLITLKKQVSTLTSKLQQSTQSQQSCQAENTTLQQQIQHLRADIDSHNTTQSDLSSRLQSLQSELSSCEQQLIDKQSQIDSLQQQLESGNNEIQTLQQQLTDAQQQINQSIHALNKRKHDADADDEQHTDHKRVSSPSLIDANDAAVGSDNDNVSEEVELDDDAIPIDDTEQSNEHDDIDVDNGNDNENNDDHEIDVEHDDSVDEDDTAQMDAEQIHSNSDTEQHEQLHDSEVISD